MQRKQKEAVHPHESIRVLSCLEVCKKAKNLLLKEGRDRRREAVKQLDISVEANKVTNMAEFTSKEFTSNSLTKMKFSVH